MIQLIKELLPPSVYNFMKCVVYGNSLSLHKMKYKKEFDKKRREGIQSIPIFIISYNRLSHVKQMIEWLEQMGKTNIIIIDNASSFPPLLEYYKTIPYNVIYMDQNYGHLVFWSHPRFKEYRKSFYIVSDPDVCPVEECPNDFVEHFLDVFEKHPHVTKVGFSLKIDDLPPDGLFTEEVVKWEKRFRQTRIKEGWLTGLDTTFALYGPDWISGEHYSWNRAIRCNPPYELRHLPWYKQKMKVTEEDVYYSEHKKESIGFWTPR